MSVPAGEKRRTQAGRRAASEAALLQAAAELISEVGVERASLRGVGARAGISRAMPGYHFGSKDGLVASLVEHASGQTLASTDAALASTEREIEQLSTLEALRAIIETYLTVLSAGENVQERAVVVMWGATFPSDRGLAAMTESDRRTHRDLCDLIRQGQRDSSIRLDLDVDAAAIVIMGLARGVAAMGLSHPAAADPARVRELCGQAITAVLQVGEAPRRRRPRRG